MFLDPAIFWIQVEDSQKINSWSSSRLICYGCFSQWYQPQWILLRIIGPRIGFSGSLWSVPSVNQSVSQSVSVTFCPVTLCPVTFCPCDILSWFCRWPIVQWHPTSLDPIFFLNERIAITNSGVFRSKPFCIRRFVKIEVTGLFFIISSSNVVFFYSLHMIKWKICVFVFLSVRLDPILFWT